MSVLLTYARRLCGIVLLAAGWQALPGHAQPAPSGIEVAWHAPPGCPGRDALLRKLHERLSQRQAVNALRAQARVVRSGSGFRLELELVTPSARATRQLSDAECAPLADAAAVLIALAVQNEAPAAAPESEQPTLSQPEPEREVEPADTGPAATPVPGSRPSSQSRPVGSAPVDANSEAESEREPEPPSDPEPLQRSTNPLRLQLSAAARANFGTFPHRPAPGMQAQLAARISPLYLALGVSYWPAFQQSSSSYPNARLRGSGIFSDLSIGLDIITQPILLTAALDLELGQLMAQAEGIAGPQSTRSLWLATGPSAGVGISFLNDWGLALELAGLTPLYRTHWLVRTPTADVSTFVAARMVFRLSLRLSYVLPL